MELRSAASEKTKHEKWSAEQDIFMESEPFLHPVDREDGEYDAALRDCIDNLAVQQKESIELFYFGNSCYRDIADKMGTDEKKIKSLLQNGKRNIKICLEGKNVRY
jgi:RNA polymerase sigma-70 factor (ECF subfamily)